MLLPDEILLTVDAMTGQDIVTVAKEFSERLICNRIDRYKNGWRCTWWWIVISSLLSQTYLYLFVSNGEKVDDLEEFHPDRMADRILGMGDIVTLVEQAQDKVRY